MSTDWRMFAEELLGELDEFARQVEQVEQFRVKESPTDHDDDAIPALDKYELDQLVDDLITGLRNKLWIAQIIDDRERAA